MGDFNLNLDTSKLKGKQVDMYQEAAKGDGADKTKIDTAEELSVFQNSLRTALELAKDDSQLQSELGFDHNDCAEIFGLNKSEEAQSAQQTVSVQQDVQNTDPVYVQTYASNTKKEQKKINDEILSTIKSYAKNGVTGRDLAQNLRVKYALVSNGIPLRDAQGNIIVEPTKASALKEVEQVLSVIDFSVKTESDVKKVKENALKAIPNATEFQKDVIDKIVKVSKNDAVVSLAEQYSIIYNRKLGSSHNYKKAVEEVEDELKANKKAGKSPSWSDDYRSEAMDTIKAQAKEYALEYVRTLLYTPVEDIESAIKVAKDESVKKELQERLAIKRQVDNAQDHKEIRSILRNANKSGDSYINDAIQDVKIERKGIAGYNRVRSESGTAVSKEEVEHRIKQSINDATFWNGVKQYSGMTGITKESSKKAEKLMAKLNKNIVYQNADGTFNLAKLAEDIRSRVGADFVLSRNDDDENAAEITNLKEFLNKQMGLIDSDRLEDDEAIALARMCGFTIERKAVGKAIANKLVTIAMPATVAGVLGAASALYHTHHGGWTFTFTNDNTSSAETKFNNFVTENGIDLSKCDYTKETTENGTEITFHQDKYRLSDNPVEFLYGLIHGLDAGAIIGLMAAFAFGDWGDKNEKTCVPVGDYDITDPTYTDPEQYKKYVEKRYRHNPIKVKAMQIIVDKYVEYAKSKNDEKNWHAYYQNDLRRAAGFGSTLNPNECRMFFTGMKLNIVQNPNPNPPPNPIPEKKKYQYKECTKPVTTTIRDEVIDARNSSWAKLTEQYSCLKEYKPYVAIRMMKVIQAITDGNYSVQRIHDLATRSIKSKNIRRDFANEPGFDIAKFLDVLSADWLTKVKMPDALTDENGNPICPRDKNVNTKAKADNSGGTRAPKVGIVGDERTSTSEEFSGEIRVDGKTETYDNSQKKAYQERRRKLDETRTGEEIKC